MTGSDDNAAALSSGLLPDHDRRRAPRFRQSGALHLHFADPVPVSVDTSLIEGSATGFRVSHNSNAVLPGLEVEFQSAWRSGRARVVWTRMLDNRWISGFLIL